jgi:hypothetical protein
MNDVEKCVKMLMSLTVKERAKVMQVVDLLGMNKAPVTSVVAEEPQVKPEIAFMPGMRYILDGDYKCVMVRKENDGYVVRCNGVGTVGDEIFVRSGYRLEMDRS